jgi:alkyl sulfatase BDS1-like metallo-beta-lactamase superfamily hydrolase
MRTITLAIALIAACTSCTEPAPRPRAATDDAADPQGHTAPSGATQDANAAVAAGLPLADPQDREDAQRGLIASEADLVITGADGQVIWNPKYDFITGDAPRASTRASGGRRSSTTSTVSSR